jgi:hypothetical protein
LTSAPRGSEVLPVPEPEKNEPPAAEPCDVCGAPMLMELHCKLVCRKCGFGRDCSDP